MYRRSKTIIASKAFSKLNKAFAFFSLFLCCSSLGQGNEGMWLFNDIPKQQIEKDYGVSVSESWLSAIQKSILRVSSGGTGSFISSSGLVMTNHHVGASAIDHLSSESRNYLKEGFYAKSLEEEIPCTNFYVDQLIVISDVTEVIEENLSETMSLAEKEKERKQAIARVQKEAEEKTGLRPEVVMLYQGARYHLYLYKRYTDVRLVMAPEKGAAFFGGEEDNFEYPRYNLDVAFFRVYEEGKPLKTEHYLPCSLEPLKEEELLFVAGHPGKTRRMYTADHLDYLETVELPIILSYLQERIKALELFACQSEENQRKALQRQLSLANALKVYKGIEKGFLQKSWVLQKQERGRSLYKMEGSELYLPWGRLKKALEQSKQFIAAYHVLEGISSNYSKLYDIAKKLVRLSAEKDLPNEKRLTAYLDTELDTLELQILSSEPIYTDLEITLLEDGLIRLEKVLGKTHPLIESIFQEKTPKEAAQFLITESCLADLEQRKQFYQDLKKVKSSKDPLLDFAKAIDVYGRAILKEKEESLDAVQNESYKEIASCAFKQYGSSLYPDATFTLRLSYGSLKGYEEEKWLEPTTTIGGLFLHAKEHEGNLAYKIPDAWQKKENALNSDAIFNFISTHDIIGGNSGSPVFTAEGKWVGLIFDGNCHSLNAGQCYDEVKARAISVHAQGMLEALKVVYQAERLVKEILDL
jgi:hypothetical protein